MAADPTTKNTVSDLLNYDVSDDDDPFQDIDEALRVRDDKPTLSPRAAKRKVDDDKENDVLGLDEEVKITKKRKPIAKLDETRLLSQPGIPKLRALARSGLIAKKLHLKGKGHEFSDAAKLLNYYQLWLDNLYPRAKFADGLQLVEKAGHSKRMQTMRKEWIDEGKPGYAREKRPTDADVDLVGNREIVDADKGRDTEPTGGNKKTVPQPVGDQSAFGNDAYSDDLFFPDTNKKPDHDVDHDDAAPEEDELDALLAERDNSRVSQPKPAEAEPETEDDLDALLAEQDLRSHRPPPATASDAVSDEDDDLDALQAEHDAEERGTEEAKAQEDVVEDEDGLEAPHADGETRELDGADAGVGVGSSPPFPTIDDEEDSGLVT